MAAFILKITKKPKSKVLETMITIPVSKPIKVNQCGNLSIFYPAQYTRQIVGGNHAQEVKQHNSERPI